MKNFNYNIIITFMILFMGCNENNDTTYLYADFPAPKKLQGTSIENIVTHRISGITVIDTFLIIINAGKPERIVQVYSTLSKNLLWEGGYRGKGADNDFLVPTNVRQSFLTNNNENALFNIWDVGRQRLTNLNITESIIKSAFISTSEVFSEDFEMIKKIYYLDDSLMIFEPELYRFSIMNKSTNEIINIPYNTSGLSFSTPEKNEYFIFTSALTVNPSLKRIAAAPLLLGQIDFFEINGSYAFSSIFERDKNLQYALQSENVTIADAKRYINRLQSDQNFIYALNQNVHNNVLVNQEIRPDNEMLIFDWEGLAVDKILFDRYIQTFALDQRQNKIYGFAPYEEHFNIIEYDLSEL